MSYLETLPCNATSVQSTDPVAWGLASMLVTGVSVIWNYGFLMTTFAKINANPVNENEEFMSKAVFWADFVLTNVVLFFATIGLAGWALQQYINQNSNRTSAVFNILAPQDVANVTYLGLSMMVLTFHKFYQYYLLGADGMKIVGKIEDSSKRSRWDTMFGVGVPALSLLAIVLFGGIYGYQQSNPDGIVTCGKAPFVRFYGTSSYLNSNVPLAHLCTSIILGVTIVLHFALAYFDNMPLVPLTDDADTEKFEKDITTAWEKLLSYQWYVFDVINSPKQKRSTLVGWLPTLHLGFWLTIALSWFFPQSHLFTHYDMYKTIGVWFCVSFLSLALSALSGSLDCFSSYFFAAVFVFEFIQYFAGAVLQPVVAAASLTQITINFGLFLTGPADDYANMDPTTVTVFVYVGLILAIAAMGSEIYLRYERKTV